ncbi:MAG: aldo/keto reductase, partial [Spirochaetota bacterium]
LSGKHRRGKETPAGTRQAAGWDEPPIRDRERLWDIVDALVEVGDRHGVSAARVALAWLLERPGVTSLVIGGRTEEQFRDSLAAVDLELSDEDRAQLGKVSAIPMLYPYWHQQNFAKDSFCEGDLALHEDAGS